MSQRFKGGKAVVAALAVLTGLLLIVTSGANASAATGADQALAKRVTHEVMLSSNPRNAFEALSRTERAAFLKAFGNQESRTVVERTGRLSPTREERAAMSTKAAPSSLQRLASSSLTASSGCWYYYYQKAWYDLGIHDGDSWMQLNWCGSGGQITSWSQSNVGCAGHHGASCTVKGKAERNVGWEIRSSRYYEANFFGFSNTFCMQVRGGATGLYSKRSSNDGVCSLS